MNICQRLDLNQGLFGSVDATTKYADHCTTLATYL